MSIFEKILEIYRNYYLCIHCLGRMFSLLGTCTTNQERGNSLLLSMTLEYHRTYLNQDQEKANSIENLKILAENASFIPAQYVLKKEGLESKKIVPSKICYLCHNIFSNLDKYVDRATNKLKNLEFKNLLVGTSLDSEIDNKEDIFKAEFKLLESESFKSHFNREVGKLISDLLDKPPEFINPDITIIFNLGYDSFKIDLLIRSLYIYGRYTKLLRGIPQTHWHCRKCMGNGCVLCNFTGKQYATSIEELISPEFIKNSDSTGSKFHGAGREDIDVRMLGEGRPFIIELINPKIRSLDLKKIQKQVNKKNKKKVQIYELKFSNKLLVKKLKFNAENTRKIYKALVYSEKKFSKEIFERKVNQLKVNFENLKIQQKTPLRVNHRRANKVREKKVHKIEGKFIKSNLFEFIIETQGGTYIKELINGDSGRTKPSFAEIFENPLICKKLDVLKIKNLIFPD
ncbi:MAG: tRNA pseudouridine(54/55) synthase Pus10 [Candidatus Hodarchaeota archaeon]